MNRARIKNALISLLISAATANGTEPLASPLAQFFIPWVYDVTTGQVKWGYFPDTAFVDSTQVSRNGVHSYLASRFGDGRLSFPDAELDLNAWPTVDPKYKGNLRGGGVVLCPTKDGYTAKLLPRSSFRSLALNPPDGWLDPEISREAHAAALNQIHPKFPIKNVEAADPATIRYFGGDPSWDGTARDPRFWNELDDLLPGRVLPMAQVVTDPIGTGVESGFQAACTRLRFSPCVSTAVGSMATAALAMVEGDLMQNGRKCDELYQELKQPGLNQSRRTHLEILIDRLGCVDDPAYNYALQHGLSGLALWHIGDWLGFGSEPDGSMGHFDYAQAYGGYW